MPTEYRLIQFTEKDLEEAVERWLRSMGELGQYGRCGKPSIGQQDKNITIDVECWDMQGRHKRNVRILELDHGSVGQAVILFCKHRSIPLAREGKKIFRLLDSKLVMYYQLS